jgi:hypothetical protein
LTIQSCYTSSAAHQEKIDVFKELCQRIKVFQLPAITLDQKELKVSYIVNTLLQNPAKYFGTFHLALNLQDVTLASLENDVTGAETLIRVYNFLANDDFAAADIIYSPVQATEDTNRQRHKIIERAEHLSSAAFRNDPLYISDSLSTIQKNDACMKFLKKHNLYLGENSLFDNRIDSGEASFELKKQVGDKLYNLVEAGTITTNESWMLLAMATALTDAQVIEKLVAYKRYKQS